MCGAAAKPEPQRLGRRRGRLLHAGPRQPGHGSAPVHESRLALLALLGQFLGYLITLLLARRLGMEGFQAYAVASAVFMLLAAIAPRGSEKYALRLLPVLIEQGDWTRVRGYIGFGLRRTLFAALFLASLGAVWVGSLADLTDTTRLALLITLLALPGGALAHYALEVLSACGREFSALALFRVVVPGLVLGLLWLLVVLAVQISGAMAIACWAVAWWVVLLVMAWQVWALMPRTTAPPVVDLRAWRSATRPFFVYRLSLAVLTQSAIIALDWLQPSAAATGAYAAAASTVGLVAVLATATNRSYARQLSLMLERGRYDTLMALRRKRLRWMAPLLAGFLLLSFFYTRELLALFGADFVEEGVVALRLLALATACTVWFALAPTYLKFQGRKRTTYLAVACTAAVQLVLLLLLVPKFGAAGAASAYAVSLCGMYGVLAWIAHREVRRYAIGSRDASTSK